MIFALHQFLFKVVPATNNRLPLISALINVQAGKLNKLTKTVKLSFTNTVENHIIRDTSPDHITETYISRPKDALWNLMEDGSSRGIWLHVMYYMFSV